MRKHNKRTVLAIGLICGLIGLFWHAPAVHAESLYPYSTKPCVWVPYTAQGTAANWCPNYDFGDVPNSVAAANVLSPYGYAYRNCTDYVAWKLDAMGVPPALYKGLGNAKDWATRASAKGLRVDSVPAAGAVGVRTTGAYGHTAYIESVQADGSITVTHFNYFANGNYSQDTNRPAAFGFTLFIHFEDTLAPAPVAPVVSPAIPIAQATPEVAPAPPIVPPVASAAPDVTLTAATLAEPTAVTQLEPSPQPVATVAESPPPVPRPQPLVAPMAPVSVARSTPVPIWRQATSSPPSAVRTHSKPLAAIKPVVQPPATADHYSYWPLVGLAGALLVQASGPRRWLTQTASVA